MPDNCYMEQRDRSLASKIEDIISIHEEQRPLLHAVRALLGPHGRKLEPFPPACTDTASGLEEFRKSLPPLLPAARRGEWRKCRALLRLWVAYWLVRWVPKLRVLESWREVK